MPFTHALPIETSSHYSAFFTYARSFRTGLAQHDRHLCLKEEHTLSVLAYARKIAALEQAFQPDHMAAGLILGALYHDLGRFPQYARYKTFKDRVSINHGQLASRELRRKGFLHDEPRTVQRLVRSAVLLHNRHTLPTGIPPDVRSVTRALRDADKLDIFRVMRGHLGAGCSPDPTVVMDVIPSPDISPELLECVMNRRLGSFTQLETTADLCLLLCAWLYDLNYSTSRHIARQEGHLAALCAALPDTPATRQFTQMFYADLAKA